MALDPIAFKPKDLKAIVLKPVSPKQMDLTLQNLLPQNPHSVCCLESYPLKIVLKAINSIPIALKPIAS